MSKSRAFDWRHIFSWVLLSLMIVWSALCCRDSYVRFFWSVISFAVGLVYALFFNFEWCPIPDVKTLHVDVTTHFPQTFEGFVENFKVFFQLFFSQDNFANYSVWFLPKLSILIQILMLLFLVFVCSFFIGFLKKPSRNNDHGAETKPLRLYKAFCLKLSIPKKLLVSAIDFFRKNNLYRRLFILIFLCSTNILSICISAFAWYFYLLGSLDILSLFYQLYRLTVDLVILLDTLPVVVWVFIGIFVFNKLTVHFAYERLNRQQAVNMVFVDSCGIVVYIVGVMRAGKTALQTSLMILNAIKFRRMSKAIMLKVHRHFPFFPFSIFQQHLIGLFEKGQIYSLASAERYIAFKREKFKKEPCSENIFGYDFERYGTVYDDGNVVTDIWQDLCKYLEAFLVFTEPTYFVSNYSVREIFKIHTVGNCPDVSCDVYHQPSYSGGGEFAHILDQDLLRPGRKMRPERKSYGVIEYGLIAEDEIDKERANMLELKEVKAKDDECNQLNDLFNQHLKMMGHAASIDFKCFVRLFATSQRASWGADGKELSDLIKLEEISEDRLALRFFTWRQMLGELLLSIHQSKTFSHWFNRGDTTLRVYLLWQIITPYLKYYERTVNTFGYRLQKISRQKGTEEGEKVFYKFYDQNKLVRSGVYATDSHASYFRRKNIEAQHSFSEIPRYRDLHPSFDELVENSNSHMYNSWFKADQISSERSSGTVRTKQH